MNEPKKESVFDWMKIPEGFAKEFLVKVVAKTPTPTDHSEDKSLPPEERTIRLYSEAELQAAARSLAFRPINLNHQKPLENAIVIDAEYNAPNVEALCYIPYPDVIMKLREGKIKNVSVEEFTREDVETSQGIEMRGLRFVGLALVESPFTAGDPNTMVQVVEHKGLLCEITSVSEPLELKGEPFAGFTNMADCIAKNGDKENPAGYCATIMRATEGKTLEECTEIVAKIPFTLKKTEAVVADPAKVIEKKPEERIKELEEAVSRLQKTVEESTKAQKEAVEKARKEGKQEVIAKVKEALPTSVVIRQGSQGMVRLYEDVRKKLLESEQ